jgi:hypothetical protein
VGRPHVAQITNLLFSPPYRDLETAWRDIPRQKCRQSRKTMGLPASSDVGVLADMIRQLLNLLDSKYSPLDALSATITFANVGALYEEDIEDAAEYLELSLPNTRLKAHEPREIFTAYAGHGMGICSPDTASNLEQCKAELSKLPSRWLLLVEYTLEALFIHTRLLNDVNDYMDSWNLEVAQVSYDLGTKSGNGTAEELVSFIRPYVVKEFRFFPDVEEITVIITGDADNENVLMMEEVVRMVIVSEIGALVHIFNSSSEYITARGAAEVQWRAVALRDHPWVWP